MPRNEWSRTLRLGIGRGEAAASLDGIILLWDTIEE
jgi:hypothetical protein